MAYSDYLISIDTPFPRSMKDKTFLYGTCYGCRSLVRLPPKLFKHCPNLASLGWFCYRCSALQTIPDDIFWGCYNVTNANRFFMSCKLSELPGNLFAQMTGLKNGAGMVSYNQDITSLPHGLLDPLQELEYFGLNSMGITNIPVGFFANCPNMVNFENLCNADSSLTSIPEDIFWYSPEVSSFRSAFAGTGITSIPSGLFSRNLLAEDFARCFANCEGITGAVPELWDDFPDANGSGCFSGCINASNYEDIPSGWR